MEFEWDEAKCRTNILKHGIDFVDVVELFSAYFAEQEDRRRNYGETRFLVLGVAAGNVLRVVYTWRGDKRRIISARRARRDERRAYYARNIRAGAQDEG